MFDESKWLIVGKVVGAQGLKGQIRVNPITDFSERFTKPGIRWLQKNQEEPRPIELITGKQIPGKSIYTVSFKDISNRNSAEDLIGQKILVPSSNRPKLQENEFHFLDLLELQVKLAENDEVIGKVTDLTSGVNALLEVTLLRGKKVLIPLVKEIVPDIEIKKGWIRITPPPGLLDL